MPLLAGIGAYAFAGIGVFICANIPLVRRLFII